MVKLAQGQRAQLAAVRKNAYLIRGSKHFKNNGYVYNDGSRGQSGHPSSAEPPAAPPERLFNADGVP
jgi:hypothetical protein